MKLETAYDEWAEAHKAMFSGFSDKKVFLMYSGGKDSSLAMELMRRAAHAFGFSFQAHAGAYPVSRYPQDEKDRLSSYWRERDIDILWYNMEETDEAMENAQNPCHVCQGVRKKMLGKILKETVDHWERLVLVPCYSLWDLVGYSLEHILGTRYSQAEEGSHEKDKRFLETAQRFYPYIKMQEGYTVFRPLITFNGNDVLGMVREAGIPYLSISCEYKDFRPKRVFETYYEKMGLRFQYDRVFDFVKQALALPPISAYTSMDKDKYLREVF